jgi:hypothetical protein
VGKLGKTKIMVEIKTDKQIIYGILGLPRTGTTLLNNIFNSYDNSFCISEPHWANILSPGQIKLDKINIDCKVNGNIYKNINDMVSNSEQFNTYREHQMESANFILNSDYVDLVIGIFRDPVSGFNAWLRSAWKGYYIIPDNFIRSYVSFYNTLQNISDKKVVMMKYEDICEGGVEYINKKLNDEITLPQLDEIKKTNFVFGDPLANSGGTIKQANTNNSNIPENIQNHINKNLKPIYDSI